MLLLFRDLAFVCDFSVCFYIENSNVLEAGLSKVSKELKDTNNFFHQSFCINVAITIFFLTIYFELNLQSNYCCSFVVDLLAPLFFLFKFSSQTKIPSWVSSLAFFM